MSREKYGKRGIRVSEGAVKKEERRKFQAIRGTRDLLPPETELWNRVEQSAHEVFATFGYGEIRLPIFEAAELFARAVGGETDIVSKEVYKFEDHSAQELAALKTLLLESKPSVDDPKFFWSYELKVEEFLERLRLGIAQGTAPKTPENERVIEDVGQLLNTMAFARQEYQKEESQSPAARFDLYAQHVANYLKEAKTGLEEIRSHASRLYLGDEITLRPEATASVCRAYIEHNLQQLPQPVKLYYMGPMFRRERPQKGRYRQFYQIGAEVLGGTDAPAIDAEVIEMLMTFFDKLKLEGTTLFINSIGHNAEDCRRGYVEKLRTELTKIKNKLSPDSA